MASKRQQLKIRLVGNDNITPEEEQQIWNEVFDLLLKKPLAKSESPAVDQESEVKSRL